VVKGICIFEHEPKELIFLLKKIKFTNLRTERYTSSNNLYNIHIKKKNIGGGSSDSDEFRIRMSFRIFRKKKVHDAKKDDVRNMGKEKTEIHVRVFSWFETEKQVPRSFQPRCE